MEGNYLVVDGISMFFAAAGAGIPILYIHGNVGSSRWYSRVMEVPGFRTVAVDMPNFGRSGPLPGKPDLHAYADSVASFIRAAGLGQPVVVAHSLGGAVAQSLAVRHPGLVAALVLVDSSAPYGLKTPPERHPLIEMMRASRAIMEQALAPMAPTLQDPVFFASLVDDAMAMAAPAWIGNAVALSGFDLGARCGEFAKPVLVIRGAKDFLITAKMAEDTAAAFPAGRLATVDHVGHALMVEDPALFVKMIADFAAAACEDEIGLPDPRKLRDAACMEE